MPEDEPEEFKWKTFIGRPVEVEAYQVAGKDHAERVIIQQKPSERTTGRVYAQVGSWIIRAQLGEMYHTILSDDEFRRLYQPGKKGEGVKKAPTAKGEEPPEKSAAPVDPPATEGKS